MKATDNYEKAVQIKDEILRLDYDGNLEQLLEECGHVEGFVQDIFYWLEDGNGDDLTVSECRLYYEL